MNAYKCMCSQIRDNIIDNEPNNVMRNNKNPRSKADFSLDIRVYDGRQNVFLNP